MFVAAIAAGATSLGADVHVVGVVPDAGARVPRRDRAVRGRDHGLGVAQPGRRQRPQGPRRATASSSTTPSRTSSSSSSGATEELGGVSERGASAGSSTPATCVDAYRDHRLAARGDRPATGLRIVLDCANGSGGVARPEILRGDRRDGRGHPRRARRRQHQRRAAAPPPRRRSPRRSSPAAPTSASRSTATPTG